MDIPLSRNEFMYKAADGKQISAYTWNCTGSCKAVVQIFHGMAEHALRYDDFARFLNQNGILVYANDHRGHGKSAAQSNEIGIIGENGFNRIIEDEVILNEIIKKKHPGVPHFILGHSFGSFLAQDYISRYGAGLSGAILSGSALQKGVDIYLGRWLATLQKVMFGEVKKGRFLNKLSFGSYNRRIPDAKHPFSWLSTNEETVVNYEQDPLCGEIFSIGFYYYLFHAFKRIYTAKSFRNIPPNLPVCILSGTEDPVGGYGRKVEKLYEMLKQTDIKDIGMKLYPGMRHEILNETNNQQVYNDILRWIRDRI